MMADDPSPASLNEGLPDGLRAELEYLQGKVTSLSGELTQSLARALMEGRELDGLLQKLVLKQADQALNQAMSPLYSMVGGLGESLLGGLTSGLLGGLSAGGVSAGVGASANIFNVNVAAQDAASFRGSETQIAASLSRAVSRGTRGL